jgi:hypothetical protein
VDDRSVPTPEDIRLYRIELLEQAMSQLRLELRDEYLDRAQMMNEYVPRAEQLRRQAERREWPILLAAAMSVACTLITTVVTIAHVA